MSSSRSGTRSTCQAWLGRDHAPGAERAARAANAAPADRAREPRARPRGVAGDRDVEVVGLAAEQPVAHRAADQPRRARPRSASRAASSALAHRVVAAARAAEIPQVTS